MKLSVSLPDEDVAVLDEYARTAGLPSRSAALQHAVRMLRLPDLEQDYEAAWREWEEAGDDEAWSVTAADGIADAAR
jgi:Arc/MetJ-type ribon-helix-helix transcriptional regulator